MNMKCLLALLPLISAQVTANDQLQIGLVTSANSSLYIDADSQTYLFPLVIADYGNFYLNGVQGGYRIFEQKEQSLTFEIRRTFDGYDAVDSNVLTGMSDRDSAWEAGFAYYADIANGQLKIKLLQDITDTHDGMSVRLEYEKPFIQQQSFQQSWYAGTEYWDKEKTNYYFGVESDEARVNRSVYRASSSYSSFIGTNLVKRLSDNLTLIASAEYLHSSQAIADSPLTNTQGQWSAYTGIFYKF